jgi:predicted tellurium resistance membrane protein TerC
MHGTVPPGGARRQPSTSRSTSTPAGRSPAIRGFALTREPFIVFTSNAFAILGLRSLYFLLGDAIERFHLLRSGLSVILVFVGLKMVWLDGWYGGKFPIGLSLGIIAGVLGASIAGSMLAPRRMEHPAARVDSGWA